MLFQFQLVCGAVCTLIYRKYINYKDMKASDFCDSEILYLFQVHDDFGLLYDEVSRDDILNSELVEFLQCSDDGDIVGELLILCHSSSRTNYVLCAYNFGDVIESNDHLEYFKFDENEIAKWLKVFSSYKNMYCKFLMESENHIIRKLDCDNKYRVLPQRNVEK
jgi:hypothetical protein